MPFRKIFLTVAGALGLACTPVCAAPETATTPLPTVVSVTTPLPSARIEKTLADYQRWLNLVSKRDAAAGLATAVVIDDKVVFEGTIGYADATTREPVTPTTVFRLASLSKAFATALTGLLVDDGKLSWDTRLIDVLPYFKRKDVQASDQATVSDILGQFRRPLLPRQHTHGGFGAELLGGPFGKARTNAVITAQRVAAGEDEAAGWGSVHQIKCRASPG